MHVGWKDALHCFDCIDLQLFATVVFERGGLIQVRVFILSGGNALYKFNSLYFSGGRALQSLNFCISDWEVAKHSLTSSYLFVDALLNFDFLYMFEVERESTSHCLFLSFRLVERLTHWFDFFFLAPGENTHTVLTLLLFVG